ncbi:MAG TPA: glycosyltransferase 87 family protein [Chloroflexia bacterium]
MSTQPTELEQPEKAHVLRQLTISGVLLLVGYIWFFVLMQSAAFYYANLPDPIQTRLHSIFDPINRLFPSNWLNTDRTNKSSLVLVLPYLAVMTAIIGTLVYILRQVARPGAWRPEYVKPALGRIFGFTAVILLLLLFVRGLLTTDIYSYVWYSRVWVEHGVSPYTHVPAEFAAQDTAHWLDWVFWKTEPAVYGPVWVYISGLFYKLGQLGNGQFATQLLSLRILADVAHLLNAWLVWKIAGLIVRRRQPSPNSATGGGPDGPTEGLAPPPGSDEGLGFRFGALLFYIWNPLLLVEFGANGHNDVVMLTFVLLAFWLHLSGRWRLAALALGLATLVKLLALLFVPGYLWLLLWEGYRAAGTGSRDVFRRFARGALRGAQAIAIMAAAWVVLYIPFWEGMQTLRVLVSGPANRWYLHTLGENVVQHGPSFIANIAPSFGVQDTGPEFQAQVRAYIEANLKVWLIPVVGLIAILVTWRARTFERALRAWGWVIFAAIIAQAWFWPWYVSWLIAPAALAASVRLRTATLIFCASSLLNYIEEQVLVWHYNIFRDLSGALIMAPPLIYLLCSWLFEVARNRKAGRQDQHEGVLEQPAVAYGG